jgi:hypothetical protein
MRHTLAIVLVTTVSTALSLAAADIAMDTLEARKHPFYTNLTPSELARLPVKTSGIVTGQYDDEIIDLPFHVAGKSWLWAGQNGRTIEFLVKGRWNNIGCHDDLDYPTASISSRPAVLFLGDSFIEAMQVDFRDTFHARLRQTRFGERFDVWACGAAGWNPGGVERYLNDDPRMPLSAMRQLSTLRPAYVMYFVFIGNDLRDQAGVAFEDTVAGAPPCAPAVQPGNSIFWFKVRQVADMYLTRGGSDFRCIDNQFWPYAEMKIPAVEEGWAATFTALDRMNDTVKQRGARLIVAMIEPYPFPYGRLAVERAVRATYPGGKAVPLDRSLPLKRLGRYAASRGLPFVNISDVVRACGGNDEYYPFDEHFNAKGHRCLADYLDAQRDTLFP